MNTYYLLYPDRYLFSLLIVFVPAFLLFATGSLLRLLSHERALNVLTEIAYFIFGLLFPAALLIHYGDEGDTLVVVLLYSLTLPFIFTLLQFFGKSTKDRYWILADCFALFLLMPFMQFAAWSIIPSFLALLYLFLRSGFSFFSTYTALAHSLSFFSFKQALDGLGHGLLIAKKNGKLLFLNRSFSELLSSFEIDPHEKEGAIFAALRWKSFRLVDEKAAVLRHRGHYYLLKEVSHNAWKELTLSTVDAEIALNEQLSSANHDLAREKTYLLATLDEMKALAQQEEKESLRSLVHDSFAEEVSLIHQVLINPAIDDLKPLKELVRRGLSQQEAAYEDLPALEEFYGLLGIKFVNEGSFEACPDKGSALSLIREATDNAIRHGNANTIRIVSRLQEGIYHLSISNNGKLPEELSLHNGLSHLKEVFEKEGGSFSATLKPEFSIEVSLPLTKGWRLPKNYTL
jgi:hypothetical protein